MLSTNDGYILYINIMHRGELEGQREPLFSSNQQVLIDINGLNRPNTLGKDVFRIVMNYDKNSVMPFNIDKSHNDIDRNCSITGTGESCFAKIVKAGWKISGDYPW